MNNLGVDLTENIIGFHSASDNMDNFSNLFTIRLTDENEI